MYYTSKREDEKERGAWVGVGKIYDKVKLKIQNCYYRGGMYMLSFLIKKQKCLYRNIPVINSCYTRKRERKNERGRKREKK